MNPIAMDEAITILRKSRADVCTRSHFAWLKIDHAIDHLEAQLKDHFADELTEVAA
jgi:hypothetical protein